MHRYLVAKEPGSFSSVNNLQLYSTKPRNEVTQWLMGQDNIIQLSDDALQAEFPYVHN